MRYAEFLKADFPRLPLTSSLELFRALAKHGKQLVDLHLLQSPKLNDLITGFPIKGSNIVDTTQYSENDECVWINEKQYFAGVPQAIWEFNIGGYQVCDRWLKDRKDRQLTYDDLQHYQKIVVALKETTRLMTEIDSVVEKHGGWPIH